MMTAVFGYVTALLMGATLGLLGAGGSVLTLPILVYLFGIDVELATAYTLAVVGMTSLIASLGYMRRNLVEYRAVLVFGIPSLVGVVLARTVLLPNTPETIGPMEKRHLIMLLFAVIVMLAASSMIRGTKALPNPESARPTRGRLWLLVTGGKGVAVGTFTGFVGAGGGFLIVPALVLLLRLPMRTAVGTSLLIIAINSLIGFTGDLSRDIDWAFLGRFTGAAMAGMFVGVYLNRRVSAATLKPMFGWLVLAVGVFVMIKEFWP